MQFVKSKKRKIVTSIIMGVFCCVVLLVTSKADISDINTRCLWFLGMIYLMVFNYFIFWEFDIKYATGRRVPVKISVSIGLTILLFTILPFRYDKVVRNNFFLTHYLENQLITIQPIANAAETESGHEIWLEGVTVDGKDYNIYEIPLAEGWDYVEGRPYTNMESVAPLTFELTAKESYDIMIRKGPNAGTAKISIGDKSRVFSFYSETNEQRACVDIKELFLKDFSVDNVIGRIFYNCILFLVLFELAFTIMTWMFIFAYREKKLKEKELKKNDRENA